MPNPGGREVVVLNNRYAVLVIVPLLAQLPPGIAAQTREELLAERREALKAKWEAQFRAADTNADGLLSRDECAAGGLPLALVERFAGIDADGDGGLSPAELLAVQERRVEAQRRRPGPRP